MMKLFYFLGDKLGLNKNHYEFECIYAWTVIGVIVLTALLFCLPALGVLAIFHHILKVSELNSWPTYATIICFYLFLFEDKLCLMETFFKYFNKLLDVLGKIISKTHHAVANAVTSFYYYCLNRFCKRIEK